MDSKFKLLHDAYRGIEKTIEELADDFGIESNDPLKIATEVEDNLNQLGITCSPSLRKGKFDEKRVIYVKEVDLEKVFQVDSKKQESDKLEFKSTFLYDIEQAKHRKETPITKLDPEVVIHEVLKTICGFLNAKGGSLYIGVKDDGSVFGLEKDFEFLGDNTSFDKWELKLRTLIEGRFLQGRNIHRYVQINEINVDGKLISKVTVKAREKESFIKNKDGEYLFYLRVGNRTDKIKIQDLPEVVRQRDELNKKLSE